MVHQTVSIGPCRGDLQCDLSEVRISTWKVAVWGVWGTPRHSHPHERTRLNAEAAHLPVAVSEFDVSAGLQDLPVLQPGELGLGLTLRLAGEDGGGAHRPGDRLWGLNKLCRSWKKNKIEEGNYLCRWLMIRIQSRYSIQTTFGQLELITDSCEDQAFKLYSSAGL